MREDTFKDFLEATNLKIFTQFFYYICVWVKTKIYPQILSQNVLTCQILLSFLPEILVIQHSCSFHRDEHLSSCTSYHYCSTYLKKKKKKLCTASEVYSMIMEVYLLHICVCTLVILTLWCFLVSECDVSSNDHCQQAYQKVFKSFCYSTFHDCNLYTNRELNFSPEMFILKMLGGCI